MFNRRQRSGLGAGVRMAAIRNGTSSCDRLSNRSFGLRTNDKESGRCGPTTNVQPQPCENQYDRPGKAARCFLLPKSPEQGGRAATCCWAAAQIGAPRPDWERPDEAGRHAPSSSLFPVPLRRSSSVAQRYVSGAAGKTVATLALRPRFQTVSSD